MRRWSRTSRRTVLEDLQQRVDELSGRLAAMHARCTEIDQRLQNQQTAQAALQQRLNHLEANDDRGRAQLLAERNRHQTQLSRLHGGVAAHARELATVAQTVAAFVAEYVPSVSE